MPAHDMGDRALPSLPLNRDLYIYGENGETDEDTAAIVQQLCAIGDRHVSEIRGGVAAWKAVGFPIESVLNAA